MSFFRSGVTKSALNLNSLYMKASLKMAFAMEKATIVGYLMRLDWRIWK
jgi:hypothetical protein